MLETRLVVVFVFIELDGNRGTWLLSEFDDIKPPFKNFLDKIDFGNRCSVKGSKLRKGDG